jgi:hypothetical protein
MKVHIVSTGILGIFPYSHRKYSGNVSSAAAAFSDSEDFTDVCVV